VGQGAVLGFALSARKKISVTNSAGVAMLAVALALGESDLGWKVAVNGRVGELAFFRLMAGAFRMAIMGCLIAVEK
jgi:uncharacterized membrane protein